MQTENKVALPVAIPVGKSCAYERISFYREVIHPNETFMVIVYGQYNAMGLIGPEHNGIAILHVNRKRVLADQILAQNSGFYGPSDEQIAEAKRISGMEWPDFVAYVNGCSGSRYKLSETPKKKVKYPAPFKSGQFVATKFTTAESKAKFANHFIKFCLSGFDEDQFPAWFYRQLSNTFGHIAHYNQYGFYGTFFQNEDGYRRFMSITMNYPCYGDPEYTFSDAEKAIQKYIREHADKFKFMDSI